MTAPTQLDELDDDLSVPADVGAPWGHTSHRWAFRDGRWIHRASCPCWGDRAADEAGALQEANACRYCRRNHSTAGVCRWARWLRRG